MSSESRKLWARTGALNELRRAIGDLLIARPFVEAMPVRFLDSLEADLQRLKALRRRIETWPVTMDERAHARAEAYATQVRKKRQEAPR